MPPCLKNDMRAVTGFIAPMTSWMAWWMRTNTMQREPRNGGHGGGTMSANRDIIVRNSTRDGQATGCDLRPDCDKCDLPECVLVDASMRYYDRALAIHGMLQDKSANQVAKALGAHKSFVHRLGGMAIDKGWV